MTEKLVTYWIFYLKDPHLRKKYDVPDGIPYAYTDRKSHAKMFRRQRKEGLFALSKTQLSTGQIRYLVENYPQQYLSKTKGNTKLSNGSYQQFEILLTGEERICVQCQSTFYQVTMLPKVSMRGLSTPKLFKPEYRMLLTNIGYWYYCAPEYWDTLQHYSEVFSTIEPSQDFLSHTLDLYGALFKAR